MHIKLNNIFLALAIICTLTGCNPSPTEYKNEFIFNVATASDSTDTNIDWQQLIDAMKNRMHAIYPDIKYKVCRTENNNLSIKISKLPEKDGDIFARIITRQGLLQFRLVHEDNSNLVSAMINNPAEFKVPGGYEKMTFIETNKKTSKKTELTYFVKTVPEMTGQNIINAGVSTDQFGQLSIYISFNSKGAKEFGKVTGANVGRQLAIVIDGILYSAPNIQGQINGGQAQITGQFTKDEAKEISFALLGGALPYKLETKEIKVDKTINTDFNLYKKEAEKGKADAQTYLAYMYYAGIGTPQDYVKATEWYLKAAENGDIKAQNNLGVMYYEGKGVSQDYLKAAEWYSKAASKGHKDSQSNLGYMYMEGQGVPQDYDKALELLLKSAEQGQEQSQILIGNMYVDGNGVQKDHAKAVEWYLKAAETGNATAQYNLGLMYSEGKGVQQDYKKSVEWCRKAAEQNILDAQAFLGDVYLRGLGGITIDSKEAEKWYLKAARSGNICAQNDLAYIWAEQGIRLDEARNFAESAFAKFPEDGAIVDTLGWVLFKQGNYSEAIKHLEKALVLDQNNAKIKKHLAEAYLKIGEKEKAKVLLEKIMDLKTDNKL